MPTYTCPVCGEAMDAAVYHAVLEGSMAVVRLTIGDTVSLEPQPTVVQTTCVNGHVAVYAWPPNGEPATPKPPASNSRPETPEEAKDIEELRATTAPDASFTKLGEFGKWLFGGTAIVASLAAGLGAAGFSPLAGPQKVLFAIAVILVSLSLGAIVWTLRPHSIHVNRWDLDGMNREVNALLRKRGRFIRTAGIFFALALLFAGLVPVIPGHWRTHHPDGVTYAIKDGAVTAVASFAHARPRSIVRASFGVARKAPIALPRASARADDGGRAAITLELAHSQGLHSLWIIRRWTPKAGDPDVETCFLAIPQASPPPTTAHVRSKKTGSRSRSVTPRGLKGSC
jgi:hypothetical protein